MITITPSSGSVTFDFDGNQYYLNNGSIAYPLNTLSMTIDESDIVSFKNQAGDTVLGCPLAELGKTKDEMEELYESSFVGSTGGGGLTPEEAQEMIDSSISGKADTNDVNEALEVAARALFELKDGKQDASAMTAYTLTSTTDALNTVVTSHTGNTTIHVTSTDKTNWDGAVTALGGNKIVALTQAQYDALVTKDATTLYIVTS